jgi:hypothetical protein
LPIQPRNCGYSTKTLLPRSSTRSPRTFCNPVYWRLEKRMQFMLNTPYSSHFQCSIQLRVIYLEWNIAPGNYWHLLTHFARHPPWHLSCWFKSPFMHSTAPVVRISTSGGIRIWYYARKQSEGMSPSHFAMHSDHASDCRATRGSGREKTPTDENVTQANKRWSSFMVRVIRHLGPLFIYHVLNKARKDLVYR